MFTITNLILISILLIVFLNTLILLKMSSLLIKLIEFLKES